MANKETTLIKGDLKITTSSEPNIYGTGKVDISGDVNISGPSGLNMNNSKITNVSTPTDPGDAGNKNYIDSVVSTNIIPARTVDNTVLTTDLSGQNLMKWKGVNIHNKFIVNQKSKYISLAKLSSQAITSTLSDISLNTTIWVDRSYFEISLNRDFFHVKEPGLYTFIGQMTAKNVNYSNNTTVEWSVYSDYTLTGNSFSAEPGVEIYTSHGSVSGGEDTSTFGFSWIVPSGGALVKVKARISNGSSTINTSSDDCVISMYYHPEKLALDTWTTSWTTLNSSTYTDIVMNNKYIHDTIYTFSLPSASINVTVTDRYFVSVKMSFQKTTGVSTTSANLRLVDQTGTILPGTLVGTQFLVAGSGETQNVITIVYQGVIFMTANVTSVKVQCIIDSGANVRVKGGFYIHNLSSTQFPDKIMSRILTSSTQTLDSNWYIIPLQSFATTTGNIPVTPGSTSLSIPFNGFYNVTVNIGVNNSGLITSRKMFSEVLISYDNGSTWSTLIGSTAVSLIGRTSGICKKVDFHSFIGTLLRFRVRTDGLGVDFITLANNCSISVTCSDKKVMFEDIVPMYGSMYGYNISTDVITVPLNSYKTILSMSTRYLPAGIYSVTMFGDITMTTNNAVTTIQLVLGQKNFNSTVVFNQDLFYFKSGNYQVSRKRNLPVLEGISIFSVQMSCNSSNSSFSNNFMIELYRVL